MSIIKSYAVGNGDMFFIQHGNDTFTIIDCCLKDDRKETIVADLKHNAHGKGIKRFISTHPDEDHIHGLKCLDEEMPIVNFYCVANSVIKKDPSESFDAYCGLRDSDKAFYLKKGIKRAWLNTKDDADERRGAGIKILWPDIKNQNYIDALKHANDTGEPNNISPIIQYSLEGGATALWMGDMETELMESIQNDVKFPSIDIFFAAHHGRKSGTLITKWLEEMDPKIIVIGEAPSEHLNYYRGYKTITQNTAGDMEFHCSEGEVCIYTENSGNDKFKTHAK